MSLGLTAAIPASHSARWNSAEVKSRRGVVMAFNHYPGKSDAQTVRISFLFVSFFFFPSSSVALSLFEILLYPSFHGSSHLTNEPGRITYWSRWITYGNTELRCHRSWMVAYTSGASFFLGGEEPYAIKPMFLSGPRPFVFLIAGEPGLFLRSAFDRIVLNAYLRAALPRAMQPRRTASNSQYSRWIRKIYVTFRNERRLRNMLDTRT